MKHNIIRHWSYEDPTDSAKECTNTSQGDCGAGVLVIAVGIGENRKAGAGRVVTGYTAKVNPLYLNYHIKAFINLEVEPLQKPVFYPFIEAIPVRLEEN